MRFLIEHLLRNVARSWVHSAQRYFQIQSDIGMKAVPDRDKVTLASACHRHRSTRHAARLSLSRWLGAAVRNFARVVHALLRPLWR